MSAPPKTKLKKKIPESKKPINQKLKWENGSINRSIDRLTKIFSQLTAMLLLLCLCHWWRGKIIIFLYISQRINCLFVMIFRLLMIFIWKSSSSSSQRNQKSKSTTKNRLINRFFLIANYFEAYMLTMPTG